MRLTRTTLLLLAANIACAMAIWWALPSAHDNAVRGLSFPTEPIQVEIEGADGSIRLERVGGSWQMTQPFTWAANPWEVQRLLGEIALAREGESRLVDPTLPAAGPGKWKLRVTGAGKTTVEAVISAHGATVGSRIARLDGGERGIATAGEPLLRALSTKAEAFRADAVFDIPSFEVRAVGIRRSLSDGKDMRWGLILENRERVGRADDAASWHFESPLDIKADAERVPRAIAALCDLRVAKFLPRREVAAEKPSLRLSLESSGRRQVLMVWPARDGFAEACLEDNPSQPFLIESSALARWEDPENELRSRQPCDFDPTQVRGIVLTDLADRRSLTLHRIDSAGATGRWEMPVLAGSTATRRLEVAVGRAQQFLRLLSGLRAVDGKAATSTTATWHRVELEFDGGKLAFELADDTAGRRILVRTPGAEALACPSEQTLGRWVSVSVDSWRTETLSRLPEGTRVARVSLADISGKTLADARLGADGRWAAEGEINSEQAGRLAGALTLVQAAGFWSAKHPLAPAKVEWAFVLRVTDRAAAGAANARETVRSYRCSRAIGPGTLVMQDEADGTEFVPEAGLAEALAPWIGS